MTTVSSTTKRALIALFAIFATLTAALVAAGGSAQAAPSYRLTCFLTPTSGKPGAHVKYHCSHGKRHGRVTIDRWQGMKNHKAKNWGGAAFHLDKHGVGDGHLTIPTTAHKGTLHVVFIPGQGPKVPRQVTVK